MPMGRDVWSPPAARGSSANTSTAGSRERSPSRRSSQGRPAASGVRTDQRVRAADDKEMRLERLRAVAAQVLERNPARASGDRSVVDMTQALTSIEALSPVARGDMSSWSTSPVARGQQLRRATQRKDMHASMLLRRLISLWRSFARSGVASRQATAQRLLQEQLRAKSEELRVTVGALERAVAVAREQLVRTQSESEQKIHDITLERDSLVKRCKQLEKAALERLHVENALEHTHRATIDDSRADRMNQLRYRDRLISNLATRATGSKHRRQLERCVVAWRKEVTVAQRTRILEQRAVALVQRAAKRRSMASWVVMVQNSRRVALTTADNELATALADLAKIRSSAQYTTAQQEADDLRQQARQAKAEVETAKCLQTVAQQELAACRAQMLTASTLHLADKEARRNAIAKRAMVALQTRTARAAFSSWADTVQKVQTTRRLVARAHARMTQALLMRSFSGWAERCRPAMVSLAQAAEAQGTSDMASFARAANHAAAETTIQLLEQQLHTTAETTVAAARKSEQKISDLKAELAAAKEAVAVKSHRLEQSDQDLLLTRSALADAIERHEKAHEQTTASITLVTQHRSAARKQVNKLKQEQQGLKLALKLAQTSRLKLKDRQVALMKRRSIACACLRLLRAVFRQWLQECWRAQLVRSEQLFSQLALLVEAQSVAVGLLEDEADSALLTSVTATTEKTKAMQTASNIWEAQKVGWSRRCVRVRSAAQGALALHCAFGAWKFFVQAKVARRATKQSWLEHDSASSACIQTMKLELEGTRAKLEALSVLGMDAGELRPDELMVLLVDAAEELAVANEAARSEAVRNDKLLKQLKADTDRQLKKISSPPQSQMGSPSRTRLAQMTMQSSSAANVGVDVAEGSPSPHTDASSISSGPGALWPYRQQSPGLLSPQHLGALPSVKGSIDVADGPEQMGMEQPLPASPPASSRPAPASLVQNGESLSAVGAPARADSVAFGDKIVAQAPQGVTQQPMLSHQTEQKQKKHDAPLLAEAVPPSHSTETMMI
eukprot:COSAG02_NODE_256_length_26885_cov_54.604308_9_plen_1021_part_00